METFLARCRDDWEDECISPPAERELRRELACRILAYGFARAGCDECGHDSLVACSRKGPAVCPACNTRRMAEAPAHLVDPGPLRGAPALPHRYRRPAPEGRGLPAVLLWGLAVRDRRIGWSEAQRKAHLQRVVDNSRLLLLPWVRIRHLVSHVLTRGARAVEADWEARFGLRRWLLETLVDPVRFPGTCYRAVSWVEVGTTTGRGRQAWAHRRRGAQPKRGWLYPCGVMCGNGCAGRIDRWGSAAPA